MNDFRQFINISWNTEKRLLELLDDFFNSQHPKTLQHLCFFLNIDWVEFLKRQQDKKYTKLLTAAELYCECWALQQGFTNDRTFSKYYLDKYHNKETELTNENANSFTINIIKDSVD